MNPTTDQTDPILLIKWHDTANWLLDRTLEKVCSPAFRRLCVAAKMAAVRTAGASPACRSSADGPPKGGTTNLIMKRHNHLFGQVYSFENLHATAYASPVVSSKSERRGQCRLFSPAVFCFATVMQAARVPASFRKKRVSKPWKGLQYVDLAGIDFNVVSRGIRPL
jgi:hypothetical protein